MTPWHPGIRRRMFVSLLGITSLCFLLFTVVLSSNLSRSARTDLAKAVEIVGRNAATAARRALFYRDTAALQMVMKPLVLEDFTYFQVIEFPSNRTVFQEGPEEVFSALSSRLIRPPTTSKMRLAGRTFLEYRFPVRISTLPTPLGEVVIGIDESHVTRRSRAATGKILLMALFTLVVLALLLAFISGRLIRPIRDLDRVIGEFAAGRTEIRAQVDTGDEIEHLAMAFNLMADRIQEQFQLIETANRELESKVTQRTRDLQQTIEELHHKEKQLSHAERIQSLHQLVQAIAHEINNPMTIIYGNMQMLEKQATPEAFAKRMPLMTAAAGRIRTLIHDITLFSSIKEVTLITFSAAPMLADLIAELVPETVDCRFAPGQEMRILGNPTLFRVAFGHILRNSIEALEQRTDGRIEIRMEAEKGKQRLVFEDNGPGFAQPERVFEPFYTTHSDRKGLGLTFVYHIVHLHGGEVTAENAPGGARVTVRLDS